jgi:hypothetical protein
VPPASLPLAPALVAVRRAADPLVAAGLVDPAPLDRAIAQLQALPSILVVGRRGSGKSSLIRWLTGVPLPIGLGGTTRETAVVDGVGERFVDTPGVDDPDEAVLRIAPLAESADAVIWVTDGLQPWTATERALALQLEDPALPVVRVISRADLVDDSEHAETVARLRALSTSPVWWADLRRLARDGGPRPELLTFPHPGPRRRGHIRAALAAASVPVVPTPEGVRRRFRSLARDALAAVADRVANGGLRSRTAVERALLVAHESVLAELRPHLPVPLPLLPPPPAPDRLDARALLSAGASWVAEGEVAFAESWEHAAQLAALGVDADRLRQALDAAQASL